MSCPDCIIHQISSAQFLENLSRTSVAENNFPLSGSIELTLRCNLRCKHCYILYPGATDGEMSTEDAKSTLDKLAKKGVLLLLVTGGEIFSRYDFDEIYLHAKRLGFLITLFTNATLISEKKADFLKQWPPRRIEISVYGRTEETYEAVTGIRGSYQRFRRGLQFLLDRNLPVYLKTMVLKTNQHEFEAIRTWAGELGVPFREDTLVNPRINGDLSPLRERVAPERVVNIQGTHPDDQDEFARLRDLAKNSSQDGKLFKCGAGIRTFHVDPRGQLHPCMMWRKTPFDLRNRAIDEWKPHIQELRSRNMPADSLCTACIDRFSCGNCAATSILETGTAGKHVDYYCAISRKRENMMPNVEAELAEQH